MDKKNYKIYTLYQITVLTLTYFYNIYLSIYIYICLELNLKSK